MARENIGILHPGAMGVSIAASARDSGHSVHWVSAGRSAETQERAQTQGFVDTDSIALLCKICSVIVSVCPPDAAEAVATEVLAHNFKGLYIDANAISPQRAIQIGQAMTAAGASFVDGSIIGGPAWKPNSTWLYLSGEQAHRAATYFSGGPLETQVIGDAIGKASALKMCFSAYTKGSTALLCAALAAAESLDVRAELEEQWSHDGSDFAAQAARRVTQVTEKAWRFAGEMEEIAATFETAGVPGEFYLAAAEIYRRISDFKGTPATPTLDEVLSALLSQD